MTTPDGLAEGGHVLPHAGPARADRRLHCRGSGLARHDDRIELRGPHRLRRRGRRHHDRRPHGRRAAKRSARSPRPASAAASGSPLGAESVLSRATVSGQLRGLRRRWDLDGRQPVRERVDRQLQLVGGRRRRPAGGGIHVRARGEAEPGQRDGERQHRRSRAPSSSLARRRRLHGRHILDRSTRRSRGTSATHGAASTRRRRAAGDLAMWNTPAHRKTRAGVRRRASTLIEESHNLADDDELRARWGRRSRGRVAGRSWGSTTTAGRPTRTPSGRQRGDRRGECRRAHCPRRDQRGFARPGSRMRATSGAVERRPEPVVNSHSDGDDGACRTLAAARCGRRSWTPSAEPQIRLEEGTYEVTLGELQLRGTGASSARTPGHDDRGERRPSRASRWSTASRPCRGVRITGGRSRAAGGGILVLAAAWLRRRGERRRGQPRLARGGHREPRGWLSSRRARSRRTRRRRRRAHGGLRASTHVARQHDGQRGTRRRPWAAGSRTVGYAHHAQRHDRRQPGAAARRRRVRRAPP